MINLANLEYNIIYDSNLILFYFILGIYLLQYLSIARYDKKQMLSFNLNLLQKNKQILIKHSCYIQIIY